MTIKSNCMLDKSGVTQERISENYYQIKNDITQMIESEIQKLLEKKAIKH